MNELALTLAEKLEITFDSVVELLPVIQEQFIYHKVISNILEGINVLVTISGIALFLSVIMLLNYGIDVKYSHGEEDKELSEYRYKKALNITKRVAISFAVIVLLSTVLDITRVLVAPQYSMLLEVLN